MGFKRVAVIEFEISSKKEENIENITELMEFAREIVESIDKTSRDGSFSFDNGRLVDIRKRRGSCK